jgi:hypothetical protein
MYVSVAGFCTGFLDKQWEKTGEKVRSLGLIKHHYKAGSE